jgi:hypothetical protein
LSARGRHAKLQAAADCGRHSIAENSRKSDVIHREVQPDGSVRLSSEDCAFTYHRLRPGVLLVEIAGNDAGQFGAATQDEAAKEFARCDRPLSLFIDAADAWGPATRVMEHWTAWFQANRQRLERVCMLVLAEAKVLQLTVAIAKHLSGTGELIRVVSERSQFELAVAEIAPEFAPLTRKG